MGDEGVYVLWWKHSDGSAGVIRSYRIKEDAEEDMAILEDVGDSTKDFYVTPVALR